MVTDKYMYKLVEIIGFLSASRLCFTLSRLFPIRLFFFNPGEACCCQEVRERFSPVHLGVSQLTGGIFYG